MTNVFYTTIKDLTDAADIRRIGRGAVIDAALKEVGLEKHTTKERNEAIKRAKGANKELNYLMILADERKIIPFEFAENGSGDKYKKANVGTNLISIEKTDQQENIAAVAAGITTHIDFDRFLSELLTIETVNISNIAGAYVEKMNETK